MKALARLWQLLASLALLSSVPAYGKVLHFTGPAGVSLADLSLQGIEGSELRFFPLRIEASYGVQLENAGQQMSSSVPVVIGRSYLVRDQKGAEYRFSIRAIAEDARWVEIAPTGGVALHAQPSPRTSLVGRYLIARHVVSGLETDRAHFSELELEEDGTYRLGTVHGRWHLHGDALVLEGAYQYWGPGHVIQDGNGLRFHYQRGRWTFEVELSRVFPRDAYAQKTP
ncbi:MAG: hypothetical protein ACOZIN_19610 [Myxococcota bacterium]